MTRKSLLIGLLSAATLMCSCSNGGTKTQIPGTIDCYSIRVYKTGNTSTIYRHYYKISYSGVYEYKNSIGESIYTNARYNSGLMVYKNRYTIQYDTYSYTNFVGWLTCEDNYYLDLNNKIIDHETKYQEYLYESNPDSSKADNSRAWECAKKGYYKILNDYYRGTIYLDITDKSLETHDYTKLSDDCVIEYIAKWF